MKLYETGKKIRIHGIIIWENIKKQNKTIKQKKRIEL